MRKMNQFMMGMLAIAATAFTSCSTDDTTSPMSGRESVENFYMKLQITGNTGNGTRTDGTPIEPGTTEESTIKSGTIWLVAPDGSVAFSKKLTAADWDKDNNTNTKPIKVSVNKVDEKTAYKVYFLANKTDAKENEDPTKQELTSNNGGKDHAEDGSFVMFNQNDESTDGNMYTVTFTADNQNEATPASVIANGKEAAIKLDRATARIDMPKSVNTINTAEKKHVNTKNIDAITAVDFKEYAPFNVRSQEYMMQKWNTSWTLETIGNFTYAKDDYGDGRTNAANQPKSWLTDKTYIFENASDNDTEATGIFLKYKATADTKANVDFADGTFYRYDGYVFTSIQDIIDADEVDNPFGTLTAAQVVDRIKGNVEPTDPNKFNITDDESKIAQFRTDYHIEVFERGEVYYSYSIEDKHYTGKKYSVLRNSIYRIDVKNIYDLGSDTPNTPPISPNYYLNVEVTVNPWVLNVKEIELQ